MAVDALGYPLRWQLTGGEVHDITQAPALIAGFDAEQVIADKGYDSNAFIACIEAAGAQAVIPPRKTRVQLLINAQPCHRLDRARAAFGTGERLGQA